MATLNFNIGVLGHVDSGKTSLSKALSTVASTACFDKNPQSKERGITLDLGFSSFTIEASDLIKQKGFDFVQYTLVDCPGHASLIKTIIGGAQIIDMMFLVIDIVKGIQTQTAECLIIGEICCDKLLIILNKLDLIEESKRQTTVEKMSKRLLKTLENTKFANSQIVAVAANQQSTIVGNEINFENLTQPMADMSISNAKTSTSAMLNMDILLDTIKNSTYFPEKRNENGEFLFSVDHCFTIKGQGAIMTGTILNGQVKVNDNIEIPILKTQKKVKSIQVFRKPVDKALKGDRCGICLASFDSKQFERGIVCAPNYVKHSFAIITRLNRIKHFKSAIESGSKFHITIGHETLLGKVDIFGECEKMTATTLCQNETGFDFNKEYLHLNEYTAEDTNLSSTDDKNNLLKPKILNYYALIDFTFDSSTSDHSTSGVLCTPNSLLIGSKLDTDIHLNTCRIAFYGHVLHSFTNKDFKDSGAAINGQKLTDLKIYKDKSKEGVVERKHDEYTLIGRNLFKKETNIDLFVGLKVKLSTGETGKIESGFGQSGKFKIRLDSGLLPTTREKLEGASKSKKKQEATANDEGNATSGSCVTNESIKVYLNFKRFIYDEKKKMIQ